MSYMSYGYILFYFHCPPLSSCLSFPFFCLLPWSHQRKPWPRWQIMVTILISFPFVLPLPILSGLLQLLQVFILNTFFSSPSMVKMETLNSQPPSLSTGKASSFNPTQLLLVIWLPRACHSQKPSPLYPPLLLFVVISNGPRMAKSNIADTMRPSQLSLPRPFFFKSFLKSYISIWWFPFPLLSLAYQFSWLQFSPKKATSYLPSPVLYNDDENNNNNKA